MQALIGARRWVWRVLGFSVIWLTLWGCGGGGTSAPVSVIQENPPISTPPAIDPTQPGNPPPPITEPPVSPPVHPPKPIVGSLGVTIGYSVLPSAQWDKIASAGFDLVRFDMVWATVERSPGVYDFRSSGQDYDAMISACQSRGIRVMFILDYGNPLYDGGYAPFTPAGRAAFAQFASVAARHYANRDVIWEIWNEPNEPNFWRRSPATTQSAASDYAELCRVVIPAIRNSDPSATIIGPSVNGFDPSTSIEFVRQLGSRGLLPKLDAVSIHPYRTSAPESAELDYATLRSVLASYGVANMTILNSEVGRHTGSVVPGVEIDEPAQASLLVRTALTDIVSGVPLTTLYTWSNASDNPGDALGNFGIVRSDGLTEKPSYNAVQTMRGLLRGASFVERPNLSLGEGVRAIRFDTNLGSVLVLWATDGVPHSAVLPPPSGTWRFVSALGVTLSEGNSTNAPTATVTSDPLYLVLSK